MYISISLYRERVSGSFAHNGGAKVGDIASQFLIERQK
jgi:hypothetical protein